MSHEPLEQDAVLGRALHDLDSARMAAPDWRRLRRGVQTRAATELARRRSQHRRRAAVIAIGLAAGLLLFLATWRTPQPAIGGEAYVPAGAPVTARVSTDELLDADLSDAEFRALLFGAANADELLMIAAEEH